MEGFLEDLPFLSGIAAWSICRVKVLFLPTENSTALRASSFRIRKTAHKGRWEDVGSVYSRLVLGQPVHTTGMILPSKNFAGNKDRFSIYYRKTKTKVITLVNHKFHRQSSEPIKTQSKNMWQTQSAGKRVRTSHDWFWFYFWLDDKVARVFFKANRTISVVMQS